MIEESVEYQLIKNFYGYRLAVRSRVPLINHIDEGLLILRTLGSGGTTQKAWCIHPMVQADGDLVTNFDLIAESKIDPAVLILAMEYRRVANNYLSTRAIYSPKEIELSPLHAVNQMLIADKIQNKKDFEKYHHGTHPRSEELTEYFKNWFQRLGIEQ